MKKLLIFHTGLAPYRVDFFNKFNDFFDMRICFYRHSLYSNLEEKINFNPTYIEQKKGFFFWVKGIFQQLMSFKPEIVVCSEFNIATLIVVLFKYLTFKKYRILSIVDDSYNMVADGNQFSWKHVWATRLLMPFIDNVINVEPRVVDFFQKKYGKGIYMPIISDDDIARQRLQRLLPISQQYVNAYGLETKKVLLFVGRLVALKNVAFVIKAFKKIKKTDCVFVIVGDGVEKTNLQKEAEGCSNIIFTGRLEGDDLYAWYNVAQVFTLSSWQEAFGAVTNEALLGGCYALVSNLAGSNCLIEENVNGNIIDPYDQDAYEIALENAFKKVSPVTSPLRLRKNAMKESFHDCIERLFSQMDE